MVCANVPNALTLLAKFNSSVGGILSADCVQVHVMPTRCAGRSLLGAQLHVTCLHCVARVIAASTATGSGPPCPVRVSRLVRLAEGFGLYGRYLRATGWRDDYLTV